MSDIRTFQCSRCGGWYVAIEDDEGFHHQVDSCGGCHSHRRLARGRARDIARYHARYRASIEEEYRRECQEQSEAMLLAEEENRRFWASMDRYGW